MLGKLLRPCRGHDSHLAWNRLEAAPETITLGSPAFADGAAIPVRHAGAGVGDNIAPALTIDGVPQHADLLVLILQDPDAPLPRPVVHLIAVLPPATQTLAEGALNAAEALCLGTGSFGRIGYAGPRPVPGHGPHRYIFQVFAACGGKRPKHGARLNEVLAALKGHVIARGRLTGTYER